MIRTPLVRLHVDEAPAEIWLKLENLQPTGSFKLRAATNAVLSAPPSAVQSGLVTTSIGNMAQGVAWMARSLGVPATVVVPDTAAPDKVEAVQRLGGRVIRLPWEQWWSAVASSDDDRFPGEDIRGCFIHQFQDTAVMAGNGTIALELVEQIGDIDSVLVPWGGGGLCTGIASALDALTPATKVFVCEPETGSPVSAALKSGVPKSVDYTPSFVDGAGAGAVLPRMWEHAQPLVDASFVITLRDTADALRLLLERSKIVVEGAAALTVAAALAGSAGSGRVVCVLSGGNISAPRLRTVLGGGIPE